MSCASSCGAFLFSEQIGRSLNANGKMPDIWLLLYYFTQDFSFDLTTIFLQWAWIGVIELSRLEGSLQYCNVWSGNTMTPLEFEST